MSHLLILVDTSKRSLEDQLAPFYEGIEDDSPFSVFKDTEEESLKEYNEGGRSNFYGKRLEVDEERYNYFKEKGFLHLDKIEVGMLRAPKINDDTIVMLSYFVKGKGWKKPIYGVAQFTSFSEGEEPYTNGLAGNRRVEYMSLDILAFSGKSKKIPFKNIYPSFEVFMKEWHGSDTKDSKTGRYGYWHNPNAKWDWYQVGGRWAGHFKVRVGSEPQRGEPSLLMDKFKYGSSDADIVKVGDINIAAMVKDQEETANRLWEGREEPFSDVPKKMTKEKWLKYYMRRHSCQSFAFIDADGNWYEKGDMGWWGMVRDEKKPEDWTEEFSNWFRSLSPDTELVAVDCHI